MCGRVGVGFARSRDARLGVVEQPDASDEKRGYLFAAGAFGWWAFIVPSYFKLLSGQEALPLEILAQRVLFGLPLLIGILGARKKLGEFVRAWTRWATLKVMIPTTGLIAVNWYFFIYAVDTDRLNHASLGYYINPLFSILLGAVFLGERPTRLQKIAIAIAGSAVVLMTIAELDAGQGWPWISLLLPASFGLYGLLRKRVGVGSVVGITFEMLLLSPVCVVLVIWLGVSERGIFFQEGTALWVSVLMLFGGVVTIVPLICFTSAVRLLPLSVVGLLQFTAPTGQLLLSAVFFGERFTALKLGAFALIWVAIGVFVRDLVRTHRARQAAVDTEMLE